MQSDNPEVTLLITIGTQGVCVLAWEGSTKSEIEDALEVVQEFMSSRRPSSFTMNGERTKQRITVQAIREKATMN